MSDFGSKYRYNYTRKVGLKSLIPESIELNRFTLLILLHNLIYYNN